MRSRNWLFGFRISDLGFWTVCACVLVLAFSPAPAGVTTRVSVASDGTQGNSETGWPSISADGRVVAFSSYASNLVAGDTNGTSDVFVYRRQTGTTERVSVAGNGTQGNGGSYLSCISADGRFVTFWSDASNLVLGDTNGCSDVFVRDRQTDLTERISVSSDGTQGTGGSSSPSVSADGRFVAFDSQADDLVPGDTNATWDVFVRDRQTCVTERVSISSGGAQGNSSSYYPSISADGRFVIFPSYASNLVPSDTNGYADVFVHDRQTCVTERVSVSSDGTQGNFPSGDDHPSISADGQFVAFRSYASNLVPDDTNGRGDIFVRDLQTGLTERVSVSSAGAQGNANSRYPSISPDGRFVAFDSSASNLVPRDTNWRDDIFVHDRQKRLTDRVSVSSENAQGNLDSLYPPSVSADARFVAFPCGATNLVPGDTNGYVDIFVRDQWGIGDTKKLADGLSAEISGCTVTASFADCFYVEDADLSAGIRIAWMGAVVPGERYRVDGNISTYANGERYVDASNVRHIDTLGVATMIVCGRSIGGGEKDYDFLTGAGQEGIHAASDLNNIGLLVTTTGRATQMGTDYLYIDDGSDLRDGTTSGVEENVGVRVVCDPAGYLAGDYLIVSGVSSCFQTSSGLARRILTRSADDIRKISP